MNIHHFIGPLNLPKKGGVMTNRDKAHRGLLVRVPRTHFHVMLIIVIISMVVAVQSVDGRSKCTCSDPSLCQPLNVTYEKEIVVFSVEDANGSDWHQYDWDHITTIVYFKNGVDQELVCYAHSRGVRVTRAGAPTKADLYNVTKQEQWIEEKVDLVVNDFMDGYNLDFETSLKKSEAPLLTALVQRLADALHKAIPGSRVSMDVWFSPDSTSRPYDYVKMAQYVDYYVIMAYDEPFVAGVKGVASGHDAYTNTLRGINNYISEGIPKKKLVLAVPWYGYNFPCTSYSEVTNLCFLGIADCNSRQTCGLGKQSEIPYRSIMKLINANLTSSPAWNDTCDSWSVSYYNNKTQSTNQIFYDDPTSLTLRYYLAHSLGLYGVGMWTADHLDYSDDPVARRQTKAMWTALAQFMEWGGESAPRREKVDKAFKSLIIN